MARTSVDLAQVVDSEVNLDPATLAAVPASSSKVNSSLAYTARLSDSPAVLSSSSNNCWILPCTAIPACRPTMSRWAIQACRATMARMVASTGELDAADCTVAAAVTAMAPSLAADLSTAALDWTITMAPTAATAADSVVVEDVAWAVVRVVSSFFFSCTFVLPVFLTIVISLSTKKIFLKRSFSYVVLLSCLFRVILV
jgi:hypothetical protein